MSFHHSDMQPRCDCCGKFIDMSADGVSWSQTWSYDMTGFPDLHDPQFRCATCTEREGIRETNCAHPERYQGILRRPTESKDHD